MPTPTENAIETYRRAGIVALATGGDVRIPNLHVPDCYDYVSAGDLVKFMSDKSTHEHAERSSVLKKDAYRVGIPMDFWRLS